MPVQFDIIDREWPARCAAWRKHYEDKGCSAWKAGSLASRKRYKNSWPNGRI